MGTQNRSLLQIAPVLTLQFLNRNDTSNSSNHPTLRAKQLTQRDPKLIALLFNERINNLALEGLVNLMTDDHTFIDSTREAHVGKKEMEKIWAEFFSKYPDYRKIFRKVENRGDLVIMIGHSECSVDILDSPANWTAVIRGDKVAE